ncbi:MAG TPA: phenylalanine--tRNA ligase subunit alpha [Gemmatimonadaceae bacterium]|nr:phenylalanine--tRNA ligase subunit alpha [Gemmatimonadaceae bacterium]
MTLSEFIAALDALSADAPARVAAASTIDEWTAVRTALVGRQAGQLTAIMGTLGQLPKEDRREAGQRANAIKVEIEAALDARHAELVAAASASGPTIDPTMPARATWHGAVHPVSLVIDEVVGIFRELGFTIALGPEAEHAWYNFGALNFPADHPAMDLHDTLFLDGGQQQVLRTHTSPVQVRTLQRYRPPVRVLAPGNVYRRDFFDPSHAPMFAQIEGLVVDEGITFADLKATLTHFARRFFGSASTGAEGAAGSRGERRTRWRPSYFPFTEPSAEMDVSCGVCDGAGCAVCKQSGWIEILGSGMVHPSVIEAAGLDSERYTGWAFGMGPARTALARHGIPDIRILYDSDVRFLEQFAR